jgi:hypothetical protein
MSSFHLISRIVSCVLNNFPKRKREVSPIISLFFFNLGPLNWQTLLSPILLAKQNSRLLQLYSNKLLFLLPREEVSITVVALLLLQYYWFIKLLTPELNPSAQICLTRFFTGKFASWTVHFFNICVKNQQIHQLLIQFINYVW